jgi:transcriptional regulator with XRE-family HTH domain
MASNDLGDFLRAHRARLRPEDVGMASCGRRRVAGLRREEVAVLAGMNTDYYARLEQGRERHPSPQILDAVSRALRLDDDARDHLHRLADVVPDARRSYAPETVSPMLRQLLELVRTLTEASEEFAELWQSHTVRGKTYDAKELVHPEVGPLSLTYQSFDVRGARGQQLVIYHAEPGSRSAQALALLGTISVTRRQARLRTNNRQGLR